ncbi:hypothetical protein PR002_g25229 [Phytophthora rubi]|uniref:Uncharacterized protein n=1 Tax=Phytophthora rubi TaxID=129364 RepID=A0A6A3I5R4_9STRA|nr:hypothetical protein PR002_g25229 [Phytophthora rubi]
MLQRGSLPCGRGIAARPRHTLCCWILSVGKSHSHSTVIVRISSCISLFMNRARNPYPICISGDASDRGNTVACENTTRYTTVS